MGESIANTGNAKKVEYGYAAILIDARCVEFFTGLALFPAEPSSRGPGGTLTARQGIATIRAAVGTFELVKLAGNAWGQRLGLKGMISWLRSIATMMLIWAC